MSSILHSFPHKNVIKDIKIHTDNCIIETFKLNLSNILFVIKLDDPKRKK